MGAECRRTRCQHYDWRSNFSGFSVSFRYCRRPAVGAVRIRNRKSDRWGHARPACEDHWHAREWLPLLDDDGILPAFLGWRNIKAVPLKEYLVALDEKRLARGDPWTV